MFKSSGERIPTATVSLEEEIGERLRELGWTLSTAESCTAGGVGFRLTRVPGSSGYYVGGIVAYSNEAKTHSLGVADELLRESGAVSESCAQAMAEGGKERFASDICLSITGIAGPTGGTAAKPVGLVYIGVAYLNRTEVREFRFDGSRDRIRELAMESALSWLNDLLKEAALLG